MVYMGIFSIFNRKQSLSETGCFEGGTDCHSHVLYGVDDGIKTSEDSLAVLAYLEKLGLKELWCTPHIMEDIPNTSENLKIRFGELCSSYKGKIKLHLAAEYMIDNLLETRLMEDDLLLMDGGQLLVETSTANPPIVMNEILEEIQKKGYYPLLAHPERYRYLKLPDYEKLAGKGIRFQLNLPSLMGYYGETARGKAEWLLEQGLYSYAGSDCHRYSALTMQYEAKELNRKILSDLNDLLHAKM